MRAVFHRFSSRFRFEIDSGGEDRLKAFGRCAFFAAPYVLARPISLLIGRGCSHNRGVASDFQASRAVFAAAEASIGDYFRLMGRKKTY